MSSRNWNRAAERSTGPAVLVLLPAARDGREAELSISRCHRPTPATSGCPRPCSFHKPESLRARLAMSPPWGGLFAGRGIRFPLSKETPFSEGIKDAEAGPPPPAPPAVSAQGSRCARCSHGGSRGSPGPPALAPRFSSSEQGPAGACVAQHAHRAFRPLGLRRRALLCPWAPAADTGSRGGTGGRRRGPPVQEMTARPGGPRAGGSARSPASRTGLVWCSRLSTERSWRAAPLARRRGRGGRKKQHLRSS